MRKAVIDVGTNSVRLLIAELAGDRWKVLYTDLESTRIGEGLQQDRHLQPAAMERTVSAIGQYVQTARKHDVNSITAVATSAVRDSINKAEFIDMVAARTGIAVEVISGEEEALLSYQGVTGSFPKALVANAMVLDIGGGSTEFIWYQQGLRLISLPLGAVRMFEKASTEADIRKELELLHREIGQKHRIIGVGGTVTTLAAMVQELEQYDPDKVHGFTLDLSQVRTWHGKIRRLSLEERYRIKGLQPKRADIIEYGLLILSVIMTELKIDELVVSERDILYGLLNRTKEMSN